MHETINAPLDKAAVVRELQGMLRFADDHGGVVPEGWMLSALGLRLWRDERGEPCFFRYQVERLLAILGEAEDDAYTDWLTETGGA